MWGMGSCRRGLDWIPSSCSREVLPLTLGISLKAGANLKEQICRSREKPLAQEACMGLWDSLVVAGMPVAKNPAQNCSCITGSRAGGHRDTSFGARPSLTAGRTQSLDVRHGPGRGWELPWAV